jgi:dolichyl-phosphate beta-glucosyltransferase
LFGGAVNRKPDISVVLPSYHGAEHARAHVPVLLAHLAHLGVRREVIIVDDGSDDGGATREVARELGCIYLENPVNLGKGAAVRRGMLHARGHFRVYTDIDVPYDMLSIDSFLYYLDDKEFDFVAGDRTLDESSYFHEISFARKLASQVYSTVVGRFVAGGWFDTQCGLKGFRSAVADDLFAVTRIERFAFDVELFYVALKRHYDIKRLPVRLRANETSTVNLARDGAAMVRDLGVIRWNQLVGRYSPRVKPQRGIDTTPRPFIWTKRQRKE